MVGCTSSVRPTSRYCTLPVTTGAPAAVGVTLLVMTGSLLPISTLAFSLLRARMRGLASVFTSPACFIAFSVTLSAVIPMVLEFWCWRSESTSPEAPVTAPAAVVSFDGVRVAVVGYWMPRSCRRLRESSSTSTSSITSGSATSSEATSFSAMRTVSGVSRITSELVRSSMKSVFAPSTVFNMFSTSFGTALVR